MLYITTVHEHNGTITRIPSHSPIYTRYLIEYLGTTLKKRLTVDYNHEPHPGPDEQFRRADYVRKADFFIRQCLENEV